MNPRAWTEALAACPDPKRAGPFLDQLRGTAAAPLLAALAAKGILGGLALSRWTPFAGQAAHDKDFLVAVTERHSREDLDRFVSALAGA